MGQRDHIQKLIENTERRLNILKGKKALLGYDTPPGDLLEIEDLEEEIAGLKQQLQELKESSQPEEPPPTPLATPPTPPPANPPPPKPSWRTDYPLPRPITPRTGLSKRLSGYSPFPRDNAENELGFLFNREVGGFWSDHPLYDGPVTQPGCPDIIIGAPGTGKTVFARALVEIGDSSGLPFPKTLPLYLPGQPATFDTIQHKICSGLLAFIKTNRSYFDRLDFYDREFVVAFLAGKLTYRRVKWRTLLPEASQKPDSLSTNEATWLDNLQDITEMEPLGLQQVVIAIDLSDDDVAAAGFCIDHLKTWQDHRLMVKLFMSCRLAEQVSAPDGIEQHDLTWTPDQLQAMADWRFEMLARFAQTKPRHFGELFEAGAYRRFIKAANGNPRRLAQLWRKLEATVPPRRAYITVGDLEKAISLLNG